MKPLYINFFLAGVLFFSFFACSSSKKAQSDVQSEDSLRQVSLIVPDTFVLPDLPKELTNPTARAAYLVLHYWDRFDFSDEKLIERPEITEQAFVDYINILPYVPSDKAEESLEYTLKKAEASSPMYAHFGTLFQKYLYQPNSPFRNEELYIPVVKKLAKSPLLSETDRAKYKFEEEMALTNRKGQTAADFAFTLASGKSQQMHTVKSDYLILMFSNPGCPTCMAATKSMVNSAELNRAFSMNSPTRTMLTILTVYPDSGLEEWKSHVKDLPQNWLNSYDDGMTITKKKLYDLKAIPTLYLLDKDKKVILKDTSVEAINAFFSHSM